jgi:type IV pilus assembly protein PilP
MIKKILSICIVPFLLVVLLSYAGCGKQEEEAKPEPVKVKSFKIDKKPVKQDAVNVEEENNSETHPEKEVSPPAKDSTGVDGEKQVSKQPSDQLAKPSMEGETSDSEMNVPTDNKPVEVLSPAFDFDGGESHDSGLAYNPEGQIDPFQPLFQGKQERVEDASGKAKTIRDSRRGKLSPLEKLDISQLKLTAIILGKHRNIAMVQESTGKGHVIKKGTYIGINSGRVVEITNNTVVIEEEVEDLLGKIIVRKRELKLQKPLGEM